MQVGNARDAHRVAQAHANSGWDSLPDDVIFLAAGDQRAVYLCGGIVYKIGDAGVNQYEHATLSRLRAEGHRHAPPTTLHKIQTADYSLAHLDLIQTADTVVIAMPYLPEDGSVSHRDVILPGQTDLNPDNVHAHGGQLWLVDAGGL